jgi:hypothetical protein
MSICSLSLGRKELKNKLFSLCLREKLCKYTPFAGLWKPLGKKMWRGQGGARFEF